MTLDAKENHTQANGEDGKGRESTVETIETKSLPTPPDGGWGWMVVFASFMIHVLGKYKIID